MAMAGWDGRPRGLAVAVGALLLAAACGSPPAPAGPRSTGVSSRAFVGEAELQLRYRYEPTSAAELVLFVDAAASGDVGELAIALELDGFTLLEGPPSWTLRLPAGGQATRRSLLSVAAATTTPRVTIVATRAEGGAVLARDTLRFIVADMALRECQPDDAPCQRD